MMNDELEKGSSSTLERHHEDSASIIHHSSFIIHHSLFIIHRSSFIIHRSSFSACYLLISTSTGFASFELS